MDAHKNDHNLMRWSWAVCFEAIGRVGARAAAGTHVSNDECAAHVFHR